MDVINYNKIKKVENDLLAHKEDYVQELEKNLLFEFDELADGTKNEIDLEGRKLIHNVNSIYLSEFKDWRVYKKANGVYHISTSSFDNSLLLKSSTSALKNQTKVLKHRWDVDIPDTFYIGTGALVIVTSNDETGWSDDIEPSTEEVQEYMDSNNYVLFYETLEPIIINFDDLSFNTIQILKNTARVEYLENAITELGGTI